MIKLVDIILIDHIKEHNLHSYLKEGAFGPLVEVKKMSDSKYSINNAGIMIRKTSKENEEKYGIKYGVIIDRNQKEYNNIKHHAYTFVLGEKGMYDIVDEPVTLAAPKKKQERFFNAIFFNAIPKKLPLDIYKVTQDGDNLFSIKQCLSCFSKMQTYEEDNNATEALVYKIPEQENQDEKLSEIIKLYKNNLVTFVRVDENKYKSTDLLLLEPDKIYTISQSSSRSH